MNMFERPIADLITQARMVAQRSEGVAFFRVAKDLYRLKQLIYLCLNIPLKAQVNCYTHCVYSDTDVQQFASTNRLDINLTKIPTESDSAESPPSHLLVLPLPPRAGET